eukprot:scaffold4101_cov267-Pinguiococcus_pyrenoidosus.AAC.9
MDRSVSFTSSNIDNGENLDRPLSICSWDGGTVASNCWDSQGGSAGKFPPSSIHVQIALCGFLSLVLSQENPFFEQKFEHNVVPASWKPGTHSPEAKGRRVKNRPKFTKSFPCFPQCFSWPGCGRGVCNV